MTDVLPGTNVEACAHVGCTMTLSGGYIGLFIAFADAHQDPFGDLLGGEGLILGPFGSGHKELRRSVKRLSPALVECQCTADIEEA